MPFPTTQVIHDQWSRHHQPVVIGSMNAECMVTDPNREGLGEFDPATGTTSAPAPFVVVPAGTPCRLVRIDTARDDMQAGEDMATRRYQVSLPNGAPAAGPGMRVTITGRRRDDVIAEAIVGAAFTIVDRYLGSEEWDRVYIAERSE